MVDILDCGVSLDKISLHPKKTSFKISHLSSFRLQCSVRRHEAHLIRIALSLSSPELITDLIPIPDKTFARTITLITARVQGQLCESNCRSC